MLYSKKYSNNVIYLIIISTIIRGLLAGFLELGNDEVYYRLYALYPDWSHFDHPLLVGILMQITTLNMLLQSEFYLRLGSVIIGAINIWIIFKIGTEIKDARTGYFASLLYIGSVYSTIITGIFILPDTPQGLFWLLALYLMIKTIPSCPRLPMSGLNMLKIGALIGLGILSKYTAIFLWLSIGIYILLFNREWLKSKWLYISILTTVVISSPILIWNIQNDFISFTFHSDRVDMIGYSIDLDYFLTELFGEILYNNPVNYILIIFTLFAAIMGKLDIKKEHLRIILTTGIPLIVTFLAFSLFRRTLPHWTAPGFTSLLPIAAVFVAQHYSIKKRGLPTAIILSLSIIILTITIGVAQINFGLVQIDNTEDYNRIGKKDPSLDMYGYKQAGDKFRKIVSRDINSGAMSKNSILIGNNWFPLANFDYYAATPVGMKSFGLGKLVDIHKYAWTNITQGGFKLGMDAYYLTDSREYHKPDNIFHIHFNEVFLADTIQITRGGKTVKRVFVYRMKNLKSIPSDVLEISN